MDIEQLGTRPHSRHPTTSRTAMPSPIAVAVAGLLVAVAAIHVEDQGGFGSLADPAWLGWGYRLLEAGAALLAVSTLLGLQEAGSALRRPTALATVLVGAGPLVGYVLSRSTGLPGDSGDVGNWGEPLGVVSLVVEATLILAGLALLSAAVGMTQQQTARGAVTSEAVRTTGVAR